MIWPTRWRAAWREAAREWERLEQRVKDLEAERSDLYRSEGSMRVELGQRRQELADAAALIPCAGSVAHRIQVLRQEYGAQAEKDGQRIEALERNVALATEREADAQARLDRVIDELRIERGRYDGLALALAGHLVTLRRDGFSPRSAAEAVWEPLAAPETEEDKAREQKWLRVVEAAQERSAGSKELYNTILADAQRWRDLQIPLEEIERRIWQGD